MALTRTDIDDGLLEALTDGKVIMGLYPVIFGWRIRAGKVGDLGYHCDWCCGADEKTIWATYNIMQCLLERFELERLPRASDIKPWTKDVNFIVEIAHLLGGQDVTMVAANRPDLTELRRKYMEQWAQSF